jgi:hypothetical protein
MSGFAANELLKSLSTYPVRKGDVPGHPFHGNQYQKGTGGTRGIPTGIHTINGKDVIIAPRADLREASLYRASLYEANLNGANLHLADLSHANLSGADLQDADLSGADLYWANLRYANLSGANLRYANLRGAELSETKGDEKTLLPSSHEVVDGFVVEKETGSM